MRANKELRVPRVASAVRARLASRADGVPSVRIGKLFPIDGAFADKHRSGRRDSKRLARWTANRRAARHKRDIIIECVAVD